MTREPSTTRRARRSPGAGPGRPTDAGRRRARRRRGSRYEVFGDGRRPTVLLMPTWSIVHSRFWKAQVGYLARHYRVVTFDGRGSGRSDRPGGAGGLHRRRSTPPTPSPCWTRPAPTGRAGRRCPAGRPGRCTSPRTTPTGCSASFAIGAVVRLRGHPAASATTYAWDEPHRDATEGWAKYNKHYWLDGGYDDFVEFFFGQMFTEPHSTKQIEDCVGWGARRSRRETLVATTAGAARAATARSARRSSRSAPRCAARCWSSTAPTTGSVRTPIGERLAELTGGALVLLDGAGHGPMARDPVLVEPADPRLRRAGPPARRTAATLGGAHRRRRRRALYLSSPIGLGHARRDLAIADGAAQAAPRPRGRLARPAPGHRGARGGRRAGPPGVGVPGQRVGAHRARGRRARPARVPGDPRDGRDPRQQLHGLRRGRRARSTTTWSSATRRGTSTTSCTRTRS